MDFNAHTNSRYTDRDGAVVVEESPRTLRIGLDGKVVYSNAPPPLYRAAEKEVQTSLTDALRDAWNLANLLTGGTGASPLYLSGMDEEEDGYVVRFRYQVEGVPVCFPDESDALEVTVSGTAVTAFTYRCRTYTPLEESGAPLLPPAMAAAMASLHPDSGLSLAYVDGGTANLSPGWLAQ